MIFTPPHKPRRPLIAALAAAGLMLGTAGVEARDYRFLFDAQQGKDLYETYRLNHDGSGIPKDLDQNLEPVDAALMERIAISVPERTDIRTLGQNLIANDDSAVVRIVDDADVWVTFLHEGAGHKNVFGYFTYPEGKPPASPEEVEHIVVLPNASYHNSGGSSNGMRTGHRIYLGQFPEGTRLGFFVVSNGWDGYKGVKPDSHHFYSLSTLNPEDTAELRRHMVLLKDSWGKRLVLGMEDLHRSGGDHDFNDVLFAVQSNPVEAIQTAEIVELQYLEESDLDGDGLADRQDDYPEDATLTTRVIYPSDSGRAQLAFEDMWPFEGDYDMNDLVLAYTLTEGRDRDGLVHQIEGSFEIKARGSAYSHGFGINFPGLAPELLESGSLWIDQGPSQPLANETGQSSLTLILTGDTRSLADRNPGTRTCYARKFNAERNCAEAQGPTIHFRVRFSEGLTREALGAAPYNPFIYITGDRLREIHLPNHPPTDTHKWWLFGWRDEGSDPANGIYYMTKSRLPWAINLTETWQQPMEKQPVHTCYPEFIEWVNSSGASGANWYQEGKQGCVFPTQ